MCVCAVKDDVSLACRGEYKSWLWILRTQQCFVIWFYCMSFAFLWAPTLFGIILASSSSSVAEKLFIFRRNHKKKDTKQSKAEKKKKGERKLSIFPFSKFRLLFLPSEHRTLVSFAAPFFHLPIVCAAPAIVVVILCVVRQWKRLYVKAHDEKAWLKLFAIYHWQRENRIRIGKSYSLLSLRNPYGNYKAYASSPSPKRLSSLQMMIINVFQRIQVEFLFFRDTFFFFARQSSKEQKESVVT